ncbi:glycosyltransferase [Niallia sp.]|uniref:glycosyltransferase n=1 Tax=Niallia sp. TaxID=2837523 RepID=UPI0028996DD6|nr:glycosyltransferase [Niallia sp.]
MKKLLFISPVFPNANGPGREKRAHQWIKKLAEDYEIHLLVVTPLLDKNLGHIEAVSSVKVITLESSSQTRLLEIVQLLFRRTAASKLFGWYPLSIFNKEKLTSFYKHIPFDTILCFRLYLMDFALYLKELTKPSRIELDMDDLESLTHYKIAKLFIKNYRIRNGFRFLLTSYHFFASEKRIQTVFDKVYVCSQQDQATLQKKFKKIPIKIMPNRIHGFERELRLSENPYVLLFVGSLNYYPNEEAVTWFIRKVLPKLRASNDQWELHVVGYSNKTKFIELLNRTEGVIYHGQVEDLTPIYANAYQIISPLHAGGGTKLKIMEAMMYGRPIIATNESVYGLELVPYEHYIPAETAEDFLVACKKLATDATLSQMLVQQARKVLKEKYHY